MNTTNLELSKQLYELSGWGETDYLWQFRHRKDSRPKLSSVTGSRQQSGFNLPAYDLGFLLRKLPRDTIFSNISENGWTIVYGGKGLFKAKTPEDCAAKLCIELIKSGVLTKGSN